jgi:hypothetical protein
MIPSETRAEHVRAAIAEIDRTGVPQLRQSKNYFLVYQGRSYPPKYVMSLAAKYATGRALDPLEFSGGSETNEFLQNLGFQITGRHTKGRQANADLATVIDAWDRLPEALRAEIVAMVKAASGK